MTGYRDAPKDQHLSRLIDDTKRSAVMAFYMSGQVSKIEVSDAIESFYYRLKLVDTALINKLAAGRMDYALFKAIARDMDILHPKYVDAARGFAGLSNCAKLVSDYLQAEAHPWQQQQS